MQCIHRFSHNWFINSKTIISCVQNFIHSNPATETMMPALVLGSGRVSGPLFEYLHKQGILFTVGKSYIYSPQYTD